MKLCTLEVGGVARVGMVEGDTVIRIDGWPSGGARHALAGVTLLSPVR